jgi:hypothetical protein
VCTILTEARYRSRPEPLEAGHVNVVDEIFGDEFVDEVAPALVPDLVRDPSHQRFGLDARHLNPPLGNDQPLPTV